jgi:hypothetical protein
MRISIFLTLLLILPVASGVQISEVMYDLAGKDTGYEWIELYNDGAVIDICSCRLFEADTNHYLRGDICTFESGEYLLIADKPENLEFSCNILDSAFSLSNSGERLCIRDAEKFDLDCFEYSSALGAAGTGESLQLVSGEWCAAEPTPGTVNQCYEPIEEPEESVKPEDVEVKELLNKEEPEEQEQIFSEPDPVKEPVPEVLPQNPQIDSPVTSSVIYESKSEQANNLPILLLLTVSITLNVVFIISKIR